MAGGLMYHQRARAAPEISLDLLFDYDPTERFNLDKTKSWIATGVVILVASGLLAL